MPPQRRDTPHPTRLPTPLHQGLPSHPISTTSVRTLHPPSDRPLPATMLVPRLPISTPPRLFLAPFRGRLISPAVLAPSVSAPNIMAPTTGPLVPVPHPTALTTDPPAHRPPAFVTTPASTPGPRPQPPSRSACPHSYFFPAYNHRSWFFGFTHGPCSPRFHRPSRPPPLTRLRHRYRCPPPSTFKHDSDPRPYRRYFLFQRFGHYCCTPLAPQQSFPQYDDPASADGATLPPNNRPHPLQNAPVLCHFRWFRRRFQRSPDQFGQPYILSTGSLLHHQRYQPTLGTLIPPLPGTRTNNTPSGSPLPGDLPPSWRPYGHHHSSSHPPSPPHRGQRDCHSRAHSHREWPHLSFSFDTAVIPTTLQTNTVTTLLIITVLLIDNYHMTSTLFPVL